MNIPQYSNKPKMEGEHFQSPFFKIKPNNMLPMDKT